MLAGVGLLGGGLASLLTSTDPRIVSARRELQARATQAWSQLTGRTGLETALQQVRTAYATEQAKARTFAQKTDELSKVLEQAQGRVKTLEESSKVFEQEREKLEANRASLEKAFRELQVAYQAEQQATTKRLAQKTEELLKAWELTQPRVKALEERQKACEQEKFKLEAKAAKLETSLRELQTEYAAERTQTSALTQKVDESSKALEQAQARAKALEDRQTDLVALHNALGNGYSKRGMKDEAFQAFQTALKLDPNHADTHYDLARMYLEHRNDREAAVSHFRRYVQLKPDAPDAQRVKGWLMKVEKELKVKKAVK